PRFAPVTTATCPSRSPIDPLSIRPFSPFLREGTWKRSYPRNVSSLDSLSRSAILCRRPRFSSRRVGVRMKQPEPPIVQVVPLYFVSGTSLGTLHPAHLRCYTPPGRNHAATPHS